MSTTNPAQPTPTPKKHSKLVRWGGPIVAAIIIFSLGHCSGSSDSAASSSSTTTVTATADAAAGSTTTVTATKTVTAKAKVTGGGGSSVTTLDADGTYRAGEDMAAGSWKASVPSDSTDCYWQVSSDANGNNIIANDNVSGGGHARATVAKGRYFATQGCGTWTRVG